MKRVHGFDYTWIAPNGAAVWKKSKRVKISKSGTKSMLEKGHLYIDISRKEHFVENRGVQTAEILSLLAL